MTNATDKITLTKETADELFGLWAFSAYKDDVEKNKLFFPSDLFYADTIPLKHIVIDGAFIPPYETMSADYRVLDKPEKVVYPHIDGELDIFMEMTIRFGRMVIKAKISGTKTQNFALVFRHDIYVDGIKREVGLDYIQAVNRYIQAAGQIWYGVQIALLHPQIKEVFARSITTTAKEKIPKSEWKNYGQKTYRYVRNHVIKTDDLLEVVYGKNKRERHALIWYVTGHWRYYKDGKVSFVQGYWKGALRETKKAETRNRELVV